MSAGARNTKVILSDFINLILSIHKQESLAFETIQACETAHRVQASHPFALRGVGEVEAGLPKADHHMAVQQRMECTVFRSVVASRN